MSIKEKLEENKKPVILAVAGVALIIILIIVFDPFGGGTKAPIPAPNVISMKAKVTPPPAAQQPTVTAKVEPPSGTAPVGAKAPVPAKKPAATEPAPASSSAPSAKPIAVDSGASGKAKSAEVKANGADTSAKPAVTAKKEKKTKIKKATRQWAVNTGSFSNKEEAEKFAAQLRDGGYNTVYVTRFTKDDVNWHRVRVGFYNTETEARKVEKAISDKYHIDTPWAVRTSRTEAARHAK